MDRTVARRARETAPVHRFAFHRLFDKVQDFERIYAIGDVHGEFELFCEILDKIAKDNRSLSDAQTVIVLLGDMIDRGPKSRQVLELLQRFHTTASGFVVLLGDHEEMMLASARGIEAAQRLWMKKGGRQTLESYGVDVEAFVRSSPQERADQIEAAVGRETLAWLGSRPLSYRSGDFYFCHAGIRPGTKLGQQRKRDLLAIGSDFLSSEKDHGAIIVHGHAEVSGAEISHNRINLDTAAYRTGKLSALGLQGSRKWLISAEKRSGARTTRLRLQV